MDIFAKARAFESTLTRTIERAAQKVSRADAAEPLEVLHAIVDAVGERIEPAGRGTRVFPFNRITVSILTTSDRDRARFEAVLDSGLSVHDRIVDRLRAGGCNPATIDIRTTFVAEPGDDWTQRAFHVDFERSHVPVRAAPRAAAIRDELTVTIVHGTAELPMSPFALPRINLGRCAQLRDHRHQLVRINHIAFADLRTDPNHTVSRRHAHIEYLGASREYRLFDDRSGHGTSVVRNGRTVPVPGGVRGIRLESGDEIVLGEARVRVEF